MICIARPCYDAARVAIRKNAAKLTAQRIRIKNGFLMILKTKGNIISSRSTIDIAFFTQLQLSPIDLVFQGIPRCSNKILAPTRIKIHPPANSARLRNRCDVFESLKEHFQNLAKTYKDSIQSVLYNDSHSFRAIVQNAVVVDDYQLRINLLESRKAIIAYETSEQLKHLLATPNRRDFSGYNHIYIIPRAEAEQRWPFIKQSYSHIPISSYA